MIKFITAILVVGTMMTGLLFAPQPGFSQPNSQLASPRFAIKAATKSRTHTLVSKDTVGYYVTKSTKAQYRTIEILAVKSSIVNSNFDQMTIEGYLDRHTFAGQAYICWDEGNMDDFITIDIVSQSFQDSPVTLEAHTVSRHGHITGLNLIPEGSTTDSDNVVYRRVTQAQWIKEHNKTSYP